MTGYLVSLLMGLVVGVAYGLVQVCSPAPPMIALVGLLGILLGEQAVGLAKRHHFAAVRSDVLVDEQSRPQQYPLRTRGATRSDLHFPLSTARDMERART